MGGTFPPIQPLQPVPPRYVFAPLFRQIISAVTIPIAVNTWRSVDGLIGS